MVNRTSEHALRAVLYLAQQDDATPCSAEAVADALGAPRDYLAKTLNQLAKLGFVRSTRGVRGGFTLAVPAERLTVAEVVAPFEERPGAPVCLLGGRPCDAAQPCVAHVRWTAVQHEARDPLRRTTIADLLGGTTAPIDRRGDVLAHAVVG